MRPLFCKHCGNKLTNTEALFCDKCGKKIEEVIVEEQNTEEPKSEESKPEGTMTEEPKSEMKKAPSTWIVATITFVALVVIAGIVFLCMYLKPNTPSGINPWHAKVNNESDMDEHEDESDDSKSQTKDDEVNVEADNKTDESDVADSTKTENENSNVSGSENQTSEGDISKAYVAGDDIDTSIHRYEVVIGDFSWEEAYYDGRRYGDKAYLVHINSDEEYQMLSDMLSTDYSGYIFWIGARRDADSYIYKWTNAENELVGTNLLDSKYWLAGEPSFYDVSVNDFETCVDLFYSKTEGKYVMNDVPADLLSYVPSYSGKIGYILEIED